VARILLTGARGYLGSAVAARLDALAQDWEPLATRLEQVPPASLAHRVVIHCAGALRHRPADWQRSNVDGTAHLLAGLREPARIVLASSRSVYGPASADTRLAESFVLAPQDGYGASKLAAEDLLRDSAHVAIRARLTALFGHAPHGACPSLPNGAMQSFGEGRTVRLVERDVEVDYLAVADAARMLVELALQPVVTAPVINLAGRPRSLHGLIETLAQVHAETTGDVPSLAYDFVAGQAWPCLDTGLLARLWPGFESSSDRQVARLLVTRGP
jgi:nucleoside-diphosphate-sugar epimerase